MQKKIKNTIIIAILIAFLAYFLLTYNLSEAIKDIVHIRIGYLPYVILAWIMFTALKFLPWKLALRKVKVKIPLLKSFLMMYAFFGIGASTVGIGQLIPLRILDRFKRNARFSSLGIMFFIGATGELGAIILALISSVLLSKFILYFVFILAFSYTFFTILGFDSPYKKLSSALNHFKALNKSQVVKSIRQYLNGMRKNRSLMSQRYFLLGTLFFIPSLLSESLLLLFVLASFNISISIIEAIFIFTIAVTAGNISLLPSGIGVEDLSLIALMLIFNVPGVIAVASLIIFRFLNTFMVIIAGYVSMGILETLK